MKIKIKSWRDGSTLFEHECDTVCQAVVEAAEQGAYLRRADLRGADLRRADLGGAYLRRADLRGADLRRADLGGADLRGADLGGADLGGADLGGADLGGADLSGADLGGADLRGADLRGADLRRADLGGADLCGADLDKKWLYFSVSPIGSENGCLWTMADKNGFLYYHRGCFRGTRQEFIDAVKEKHGGTNYEKQYMAAVALIDLMVGTGSDKEGE